MDNFLLFADVCPTRTVRHRHMPENDIMIICTTSASSATPKSCNKVTKCQKESNLATCSLDSFWIRLPNICYLGSRSLFFSLLPRSRAETFKGNDHPRVWRRCDSRHNVPTSSSLCTAERERNVEATKHLLKSSGLQCIRDQE